MAERLSLRDYQLELSARLQRAETDGRAASKLGLEAGGAAWLVDLTEAGEMLPVPPISAVPLARPWFRGVANIRGNLYSVVDFAAFLGGEATAITRPGAAAADQRPLPRRLRAARRAARSACASRASSSRAPAPAPNRSGRAPNTPTRRARAGASWMSRHWSGDPEFLDVSA